MAYAIGIFVFEGNLRKTIFITGGVRSGKSSFALKKANSIIGKKAYIATLRPLDKEMRLRAERHKKERGLDWDIYEETLNISGVIKKLANKYNVILIDCLTLWLSNLMHTDGDISHEIETLVDTLRTTHKSSVFIVSNEVGMGIVPDNKMARRFRDWAGILNQKVAEVSGEVYLMVSGMPVKIKS